MSPRLHSLFANIGALALVFLAFIYLATRPAPMISPVVSVEQTEATTSVQAAAASVSISTPSLATSSVNSKTATPVQQSVTQTPPGFITRIKDPYAFPAKSPSEVNTETRGALVNILCTSRNGSLAPISASGVIIDSKGVILTNAHVAQYVLLSQSPRIDLSCTIRTGSPATRRWHAVVLYIPPVWVNTHVSEITTPHPFGTGEHDYALLLIDRSVDGSPLPSSFPALSYDTREAIGFTSDQVLVASYPAEFLGGLDAESGLFPASSFTAIGKLMTIKDGTVDIISLGGIIEAQSGSSGGGVVNAWGQLIGLIVTTSEAKTTAERDLHALTLSYINHDLLSQSQSDLAGTLNGDVESEALDFDSRVAPALIQLYIDQISPRR